MQKNIISAQKKQKEQYDKKHSKAVFYSVGTQVLKKDFRKKKRKRGKLDFPWVGPYLITKSLGKGFYELQSCGKGPVTTIPRVSHVHIKVYKSLSCSPSRRLQSPSASNESHSTPSPGRNSPALGASPPQSAVSLSLQRMRLHLLFLLLQRIQHLLYCKKVITQVNFSIHPYSQRSQSF